MNKLLTPIVIAVLLISGEAYASDTTSTSTSSASQSTTATGTATNAGNAQSITFTAPADTTSNLIYSGTQTIRNTPGVGAPNLTSSNDTCMGAASGSANGPGFGVSIGKTYTDENCVLLKNSRELWNMGMKAAALARMCMDAANKESLESTGFECPQTTRARKGNLVQPGPNYNYAPPEYTDPIIRRRLGLPDLPGRQ